MSSSERNLTEGQPRWDFGVQCYKEDRDVFCERGLISIIVIAHGRPEITRQTVLGTLANVDRYAGEVEFIFVENGNCVENYDFFQGLDLERKTVISQRNYGINEAINQGWALSRGEYVMILENDWETKIEHDFLGIAVDIFKEQQSVGMIQLRDPRDPNENHGLGKVMYNPWSCNPNLVRDAGIVMSRQKTDKGHTYLLANHPNGFNNNPILIRKQLYRECGPYPEAACGSDPRHGESLYQSEVAKTQYLTAYIGLPLYCHSGRVQTQAN